MQRQARWYLRCGTLALLFSLLACQTDGAQTPARPPGPGAMNFPASVSVKLVPPAAAPGDVVKLQLTVSLDPGFHTYDFVQPDPDLKDLASQLSLDAPAPLEVLGEWTGTPPEEKVDELLQKRLFVHHASPTWERELKVPAGTLSGEYKIAVKLRLTVCNEFGCLPPKTEKFEVPLSVGARDGAAAPPGENSSIQGTSGATTEGSVAPEAPKRREADPESDPPDLSTVLGQLKPKHIDRRVESIGAAIGFGLLAGLILNVMPCVLPVISLKIYGFVKQARQAPARIRLLGLSFSAGIVFVFLIFGVTFAYFGQKWGDLFKSDIFIVSMVQVLVLCTLWMFEVILFNPPGIVGEADAKVAERKDLLGEFFKGMLATVLSTPCSGPLLIPVTSFAIGTGSAPVIFATVTAVGLGMALPYIVLAFNPGWMKILPKPGDWMRTFKELMAFLLLAIAIWLLWSRRSNGELVFWTVAFSSFVAMAGWIYGRFGVPLNSAARRVTGIVVALLLVFGGGYFCFGFMYVSPQKLVTDVPKNIAVEPQRQPDSTAPVIQDDGEYHWKPFDLDAVLAARSQGRTVVVDWTADW